MAWKLINIYIYKTKQTKTKHKKKKFVPITHYFLCFINTVGDSVIGVVTTTIFLIN